MTSERIYYTGTFPRELMSSHLVDIYKQISLNTRQTGGRVLSDAGPQSPGGKGVMAGPLPGTCGRRPTLPGPLGGHPGDSRARGAAVALG